MTSACGFSTPTSNPGDGDDVVTPVDASIDSPAVEVDAFVPPVALPLFAASNQMLYRLDVDLHTSTLFAAIAPAGASPIDLDGLALSGDTLLGITAGGGELITIEHETALVTGRVTLTPPNTWGGLTVIPAGDLGANAIVLSGAANDGKLYRIDPTTGVVGMVGSFGGGMRFFSDLAWVHGVGLFGTLTGGSCAEVCFARIDPMTGTATVFRSNLGANLYGMSGYRNKLWAFNNAGPVLSVNQTTGVMALEFDPAIPWTEAAQ
ncbi:hypothetical protein BH11MYX3_BH11MYX3_01400 [soil metagenome]